MDDQHSSHRVARNMGHDDGIPSAIKLHAYEYDFSSAPKRQNSGNAMLFDMIDMLVFSQLTSNCISDWLFDYRG
jgi:hypothetical protein